jgi:hypothetical protein
MVYSSDLLEIRHSYGICPMKINDLPYPLEWGRSIVMFNCQMVIMTKCWFYGDRMGIYVGGVLNPNNLFFINTKSCVFFTTQEGFELISCIFLVLYSVILK